MIALYAYLIIGFVIGMMDLATNAGHVRMYFLLLRFSSLFLFWPIVIGLNIFGVNIFA